MNNDEYREKLKAQMVSFADLLRPGFEAMEKLAAYCTKNRINRCICCGDETMKMHTDLVWVCDKHAQVAFADGHPGTVFDFTKPEGLEDE